MVFDAMVYELLQGRVEEVEQIVTVCMSPLGREGQERVTREEFSSVLLYSQLTGMLSLKSTYMLQIHS